MQQLIRCIDDAAELVKDFCSVELILINDSPLQKIEYKQEWVKNISICILNNLRNLGIHKSRVVGLNYSKAEYVLMLDQDDIITKDYFLSQLKYIGNASIVVANGICESGLKERALYRKMRTQKFLINKKIFIGLHNPIISPGQCLIKREAIPKEWYNTCLLYTSPSPRDA